MERNETIAPRAPLARTCDPVFGPRRYRQRCINGAHVGGGCCAHAGGTIIGGSCYVTIEPAKWILGQPLIGGGIRYTVESGR